MSTLNIPEKLGTVSAVNSSVTPLGSAGVFTGVAEDVSDYSQIVVNVHSDVIGAVKGLRLELSSDGTNWDRAKAVTATANASQTAFGGVHSLAVSHKYFRVVYTNGAGAQAEFRLQTIYHRSKSKHLTSSLDQDIDDQADVELTRAALMGQLGNGKFGSVGVDNVGRIRTDLPRTAYGEALVENAVPVVQIDAVYGILDTDVECFSDTGGSAGAAARMFQVQSGTSVGGYGTIRSKRALRYRPGAGAMGRFTALFDAAAVALSTQLAGLFVAENGLFFGYDGTSFGVMRQTGGALEIQTLTVTGADGTGGSATVTLDGVAFNPTLTGGGSVQDDAAELAAFTYAGWNARQVDDTVIFLASDGVGNKAGAMTYAGPVDGTGTLAETQAGAANTDTWVPQSSWNIDTLDGSGDADNRSGFNLDPAKLNVYQISYQWLGAGVIEYAVEGTDGVFTTVHREAYNNANVVPSLSDPSLKLGWASASLGSSGTNLVVKGASALGSIQGMLRARRNPRAISNSKAGIGTTWTNIISIRSGDTFKGVTSQKELLPIEASASVDGTKVSEVAVFLNPVVGGTQNWQYIDEANSMVETDVAGTTVTGGEELYAESIGKTGSGKATLKAAGVTLEAGDVLVVAVRTSSGTTDADASIDWQED